MSRALLLLLVIVGVLAVVGSDVRAQAVGDTAAAVEAACGRPIAKRTTQKGELWLYANGVRVTLAAGKVVAVDGVADSAGSSERMTVVPEAPRRAAASVEAATDDGSWFPGAPRWAIILAIALGGVAVVCKFGVLIEAFKASPLWVFGCIFVPGVNLMFVITHWQDVKRTVLVGTAAAAGCMMILISVGPAPLW